MEASNIDRKKGVIIYVLNPSFLPAFVDFTLHVFAKCNSYKNNKRIIPFHFQGILGETAGERCTAEHTKKLITLYSPQSQVTFKY